MSWRADAAPAQHPVAISTASAAADIFNIGNRRAAAFMAQSAAEKDENCCQITATFFTSTRLPFDWPVSKSVLLVKLPLMGKPVFHNVDSGSI